MKGLRQVRLLEKLGDGGGGGGGGGWSVFVNIKDWQGQSNIKDITKPQIVHSIKSPESSLKMDEDQRTSGT